MPLPTPPAPVQEAWNRLKVNAHEAGFENETQAIACYNPKGDNQWFLGSNYEDGMGTYVYTMSTDSWVYRESWSGRDTPATFEQVMSDMTIWFTG